MHTVIRAVINRYALQSYESRFEVLVCTVLTPYIRKKNLLHKLFCVIRIFMRKILVVQCHPRNSFNIEYFQTTVYGTHDEY